MATRKRAYLRGFKATWLRPPTALSSRGQADEPKRSHNFRVAVVVDSQVKEVNVAQFVKDALTRKFLDNSWRMVDPAHLKAVRQTWDLSEIDAGKIPSSLTGLDADVLVVISAHAEHIGTIRRSKIHSSRASLSARAIAIHTALP